MVYNVTAKLQIKAVLKCQFQDVECCLFFDQSWIDNCAHFHLGLAHLDVIIEYWSLFMHQEALNHLL